MGLTALHFRSLFLLTCDTKICIVALHAQKNVNHSTANSRLKGQKPKLVKIVSLKQFCGAEAGAGGAEII